MYVYGVTGDNLAPGEKDVVAAIVVSDDFDAKQAFDFCKDKLESGYIPSYLQVVDQIPKTASEKPQERFLLEAFAINSNNVFTSA